MRTFLRVLIVSLFIAVPLRASGPDPCVQGCFDNYQKQIDAAVLRSAIAFEACNTSPTYNACAHAAVVQEQIDFAEAFETLINCLNECGAYEP